MPGRIASIVNIHNPSIEVHTVDPGLNTGAAVILAAGGGHNTLNVGTEAADFVPFFYNYGVNTIILRNRLRRDGYNPQTDEVYDAQQAIRIVRAYAKEWHIDPNKIGIMGFSAGAELAAPAAIFFDDFDKNNNDASDPFAGISSRPDFVGHHLSRPFAVRARSHCRRRSRAMPRLHSSPAPAPAIDPCRLGHRIFQRDARDSMPNIEMHIYGNGRHPGDVPDGGRMTGGLTDRTALPSAPGNSASSTGSAIWVFCRGPALRPRQPGILRR